MWADERIAQWERDFAAHIQTMNARRRRQANSNRTSGSGRTSTDWTPTSVPRAYLGSWCGPRPDQQVLRRARGHRLYAQYHLIAFRCLWRGESCGLRWTDVDLANGTAAIRWQITQIGVDTFEGKPKSEAGEATVSLDSITVKELRAHKARQNAERLAAGDRWTETGYAFTTPTSQPVDPNDVTEQFEQLSMETGLPPIRLHDSVPWGGSGWARSRFHGSVEGAAEVRT
ncbi:hypothetical protein K8Z49_23155 [Actinomadura madurae]|uniref:hypothetical protein n=1 Tax=Actinomadura madurae TaxID=1993 RepID=UPI00399A3358